MVVPVFVHAPEQEKSIVPIGVALEEPEVTFQHSVNSLPLLLIGSSGGSHPNSMPPDMVVVDIILQEAVYELVLSLEIDRLSQLFPISPQLIRLTVLV